MLKQSDLFSTEAAPQWVTLPMQDASVRYCAHFLDGPVADEYFEQLLSSLKWRQDHIKMYGKEVKIPREHAWYGEPDARYVYSNLTLNPLPWTSPLSRLRTLCEEAARTTFNSVLANHYRDGDDSMGWHADDEPELGPQPIIASLTLGGERDFDFRHLKTREKVRLPLAHGSLLIMAGDTQKHWHHGISKRKGPLQGRINLTFRTIHSERTKWATS